MSDLCSIAVEEEEEATIGEVSQESTEDPPMSEWSSLLILKPVDNKKLLLQADGLYSPGSGEICGKYIEQSDSDLFRHCFYNYPSVVDPGIVEALLLPEKPVIYADDGQDLYLAVCNEMNQCPVRMFHRALLTDEVNLSHYCVQPKGVQAMTRALEQNMTVERFSLLGNFLTDDACWHIGQMLKSNSTITELNLSGCRIGPSGMLHLSSGLPTYRSLVKLDLSGNELGEEGGEHFAKLLSEGFSVSQLNLSNNKLGQRAAAALAESVYVSNNITHLDLSWNLLEVPSTPKLLEELSNNIVLQEINLSWNFLQTDRVAKAIRKVMIVSPIKYVNLSNNKFSGTAVQAIVAKLDKCKELITLDLSFNPLTTTDAYVVISRMLKSVSVQNVLLESVCVDRSFVEALGTLKSTESRKNLNVIYGGVLHDYEIEDPDMRELLLRRAEFVVSSNKKRRADIALVFLKLKKERSSPIMEVKDLMFYLKKNGVRLNEYLVSQLGEVFPGPKGKQPTIDLEKVVEFLYRLWPGRQLPPTPPPEPEPEPPKKEKLKGKGKQKQKKKKK